MTASLYGACQARRTARAAEAVTLIARVLGADKADVFLHDLLTDSLVVICPPVFPMEALQRGLSLDRLPLADSGLTICCFRTSASFRTGHTDRDPSARQDIVATLGVFSAILCRLHTDGTTRSVLQAADARTDYFTETDLGFLESAGTWIGRVTARATLVARIAGDAVEEGRARATDERGRLSRREGRWRGWWRRGSATSRSPSGWC